MVKLQLLLKTVIETYEAIIIDDYDTQKRISRVEILSPASVIESHTLYLCDDPITFIKAYSAHFSNSKLKECFLLTSCHDVLPFTVIKLNRPIPTGQLFNTLNEALLLEDKLAYETSQFYDCLNEERDIHAIMQLAESLLNCSISLCDASYHFIVASSYNNNDTYQSDSYHENAYLPQKEIASLKHYHVIDQIYLRPSAFAARTPDYPDINWIFCSVRISNVMVGFIAICLGDHEASSYQLRLATVLSTICSIAMQRQENYPLRTGHSYENLLTDLLEGKFNDAAFVTSQAALLGCKLEQYFCVLYFASNADCNNPLFHKKQITTLRQFYTASMSVVYQEGIVLLISEKQPILISDDFLSHIREFARLNHLKVGISQPFSHLLQTDSYFIQAAATLKAGQLHQPDKTLYIASELLPLLLLSNCSLRELEGGMHYHLHILMAYDKENHTHLLSSLEAFLHYDRSAAKAAEALNIHRTTFFYRLKKIEDLLSIDLSDSHLLFLYELSFKTLAYIKH